MHKKKKNYFLVKITFVFFAYTLAIYLISFRTSYLYLIAAFIIGIMNAHSIQLLHQCAHYRGFSNKNLNDTTGRILGILTLIEFTNYRISHFKHHRYLGTTDDKEFFGFQNIRTSKSFIQILPHIFGIPKLLSISSKKNILSLHLILWSLLFLTNYLDIALVWILSLLLITEPLHFLIEFPEHYNCPQVKNKHVNTRSITNPSIFIKWFTNWNHLHSEHHQHPSILPEYLVVKKNVKDSSREKDYVTFYKKLLLNTKGNNHA